MLERKYEKRVRRFVRITGSSGSATESIWNFSKKIFCRQRGVSVVENSQMGVIYIQGETLVGDKLPKLATLYLLILKLIYDEQMA